MHMAWVRQVCGRLESRYRYSAGLVYNNFPWPVSVTDKQSAAVEAKAQAVLFARQQFPDDTLADLYNPLSTPAALVKAHTELDRAVDLCYRPEKFESDRQRVEFLFALYEKLTAPLLPAAKTRGARAHPPKPRGLYAQKLPPGKSLAEAETDTSFSSHFLAEEPLPFPGGK